MGANCIMYSLLWHFPNRAHFAGTLTQNFSDRAHSAGTPCISPVLFCNCEAKRKPEELERTNNSQWTSEETKWKNNGIRRMEDGEDGIISELKEMEEEKKDAVNKVAVKK